MESGQNGQNSELTARLAVCVVAAVAAVYGLEKLCEGKNYPLWEKYGPWLKANKLQAIALLSALLYGLSQALPMKPAEPGFTPCP